VAVQVPTFVSQLFGLWTEFELVARVTVTTPVEPADPETVNEMPPYALKFDMHGASQRPQPAYCPALLPTVPVMCQLCALTVWVRAVVVQLGVVSELTG
jgi:hypothetical protein